MLGQRRRRWNNIKLALGQRLVFSKIHGAATILSEQFATAVIKTACLESRVRAQLWPSSFKETMFLLCLMIHY